MDYKECDNCGALFKPCNARNRFCTTACAKYGAYNDSNTQDDETDEE